MSTMTDPRLEEVIESATRVGVIADAVNAAARAEQMGELDPEHVLTLARCAFDTVAYMDIETAAGGALLAGFHDRLVLRLQERFPKPDSDGLIALDGDSEFAMPRGAVVWAFRWWGLPE